MLFYDIKLEAEANISVPIDDEWNGFCYVYEGEMVCDQTISKNQLGVVSTKGVLHCTASKVGTQFILVAGIPLNEPVARGGPFVMNTKEEVMQAFSDYQAGRLG